jgi:acylphosphatase
MMKRLHIWVKGIVQGVYFRHNTAWKAAELNVHGWVRNLGDGRVEIVCEGEETVLKEMLDWSKHGPVGAYVEGTETEWEQYTGEFSRFKIDY